MAQIRSLNCEVLELHFWNFDARIFLTKEERVN